MGICHSQAGTTLEDDFLWMALDLIMDSSCFLVTEFDVKSTNAILQAMTFLGPKFHRFKLVPGKLPACRGNEIALV